MRLSSDAFMNWLVGSDVRIGAIIVLAVVAIVVVRMIIERSRSRIGAAEKLGVDAFAESSINIKVMFKTQPIKQWEVGREFRRRVKNVFDAKGIQIAYPAHVVTIHP